jgi:ketosteroid isomerase-like protein
MMAAAALAVWSALGHSQQAEPLPDALAQMVKTEQAFAAHAKQVRWKQAFLDYFADAAVGFDEGKFGPAREQIRQAPDPPPDHQLLWEPRFGDVSGSGELGYLTGPSQSIQPSRDKGRPRHSVYASLWKRQRDGEFRVVLDVGVPTPGPAAFAVGFVRAPHADRFTGDYDDTTPPLSAADGVLNSVIRTSPAKAYNGRLAPGVRFHRPNAQPVVGEGAAAKWLNAQPAWETADSMYAESARSGDIGYSWGSYSMRARGKTPAPRGFYVRVWARERSGQWKVALDVLQPQ